MLVAAIAKKLNVDVNQKWTLCKCQDHRRDGTELL